MTDRQRAPVFPRSLDAKTLYGILIAALAALVVYFGVYRLSSLALERVYMNPRSVSARQAEIYADLSAYVTDNAIAGTDADALARWSGSNAYITVLIYRDNVLSLRLWDGKIQYAANMESYERLQYASQYGRLYPMRFADGIYHIAIGDSTAVREDNVNRIIAVLLGALTFVTVMLLYIRRVTKRIVQLSREAGAIGGGDLEAPITVSGGDEIAALARDMDQMRRSVIERMGNERRAWEANSELITAISHDIRTPMTALLGYLGLLSQSDLTDTERDRQFIASANDKAMELKDLTDELFRYCLVFSRSELELNMESFDARLLLEQLLGEAEFDLRDAGFSVRRLDFEGEAELETDPMYLKRVLDNLVSNVKKYADREKPVMILAERGEKGLTVCVSNTVAAAVPRVESTKIGLRTCEKILAALGGSFTTRRDESHFAAEFTLPLAAP